MEKSSNVIYSICMFCGIAMGTKRGENSKGLSHGECPVCHSYHIQLIDAQLKRSDIIAKRKLSKYMKEKLDKLNKRIDMIKNILSFRKWAVKNRGLKIRPARRVA